MDMPSGYSFVAASALYKKFSGMRIYIKYKNKRSDGIRVVREQPGWCWFDCPDREIVMVQNEYLTDAFRPDGFDKVIAPDFFNDHFNKHMELDYVMTNFVHDGSDNTHRDKLPPRHRKTQMLSDSGGLQVVRGTTGIFHPKKLIDFYNDNVDAGMILDFPLWFHDEKIAKRAAILQKRNNNILLEHARPGLELINIFHGRTLDARRKYRDIVEDDRIPRVAIGGMLTQTLLTAVNTMYEVIYNGNVKYKQHHALGVFKMEFLMLLVKIANTGDKPHITSDSTSHIQAARTGTYHIQYNDASAMSRVALGRNSGNSANSMAHLLCNCPICAGLKYRDLMAFMPSRFCSFLGMHNGIEMTRYTKSLQEACRSLTPSQYNKYCLTQMKNSGERKELQMALDFIDIVGDSGLAKAQKKYSHMINEWRNSTENATQSVSLFDTDAPVDMSGVEIRERTIKCLDDMEKMIS